MADSTASAMLDANTTSLSSLMSSTLYMSSSTALASTGTIISLDMMNTGRFLAFLVVLMLGMLFVGCYCCARRKLGSSLYVSLKQDRIKLPRNASHFKLAMIVTQPTRFCGSGGYEAIRTARVRVYEYADPNLVLVNLTKQFNGPITTFDIQVPTVNASFSTPYTLRCDVITSGDAALSKTSSSLCWKDYSETRFMLCQPIVDTPVHVEQLPEAHAVSAAVGVNGNRLSGVHALTQMGSVDEDD